MGFQHILFEARDGVARLTLPRPDALNSLTDAMHRAARRAGSVQADPAIRVLVLSGAGRGFAPAGIWPIRAWQGVDGKLPDLATSSNATTNPFAAPAKPARAHRGGGQWRGGGRRGIAGAGLRPGGGGGIPRRFCKHSARSA